MPIWRKYKSLKSRPLQQVNNSASSAFPISEDFYVFVKRSFATLLERYSVDHAPYRNTQYNPKKDGPRIAAGRLDSRITSNYATVMSFD